MFVIVWQFDAQATRVAEFEEQYRSTGAWAQLFSRSEHYLGTRLLRDTECPQRYITLDLWQSEAAFQEFTAKFAQEYKALDATLERLTVAEARLGSFSTAEEDWRAIQETLYLLSIPGMRESIREGLDTPLTECAVDVDALRMS